MATVYEQLSSAPDIRPTRLREYSMSTDSGPGEITGQYLRRLGHRNAAWVESATAEWSHKRLAGLRKSFILDNASTVTTYTLTETADWADPTADDDPMRPYILKFIRQMRGRTESAAEWDDVNIMRHRIAEVLYKDRLQQRLFELLDTVAANRNHTVWVCHNDLTALMALRYCARHRIAVSERVSVVGFDNVFASQVEGLTSFDSNMTAYVRDMLGWILSGSRPEKHDGAADKSFRDHIVERQSVRTIVT